jgi:hypothetical protein
MRTFSMESKEAKVEKTEAEIQAELEAEEAAAKAKAEAKNRTPKENK